MIYGYARVSTIGQSLEAQIEQLRAAGAERIFRETVSGAKTNRDQLRRALAKLEADDVLIVTRLDRLARSTRDLLNILASIGDQHAAFRSLGDHNGLVTVAQFSQPCGAVGLAEQIADLAVERKCLLTGLARGVMV